MTPVDCSIQLPINSTIGTSTVQVLTVILLGFLVVIIVQRNFFHNRITKMKAQTKNGTQATTCISHLSSLSLLLLNYMWFSLHKVSPAGQTI